MLVLLMLLFNVILGIKEYNEGLATSIFKNNKLYVYEPYYKELGWSGLNIYNLVDGPISSIKPQLFNLTNVNPAYTPQFLQLPKTMPDNRSNRLYMIGGLAIGSLMDQDINKENMNGEIINDSEIKFNNDFIPMPPFKSFPKGGFSQTIVNNNNVHELYIIGGLIYSKEMNTELITNYFFKYEFNTGKWSDLSDLTKSILQPRAYHKVINVDGSLLLIGGIQNNKTLTEKFEHTVPVKDEADISDISTIFKFDLANQKWTTVETKLNKDASTYRNGTSEGSSFDLYNGKIISYTTLVNYEYKSSHPQIGVLDYKTWEWEWHNVKTEVGTDNNLILSFHQTIIINDQLILIHGKFLNIKFPTLTNLC
jgi:hypothetical protein